MTSLAAERLEQRRWKLRPQFAGMDAFDRLVENEFLPRAAAEAADDRALVSVVRFAAERVPYYRDLFARLRLAPRDIAGRRDLGRLPLLTKQEVREHFERLQPATLPAGVQIWGVASSSGSTGPPTRVAHSTVSNSMFTILNQRQNRWFRREPARTQASIRVASGNLQPSPGKNLADGETLRVPRWRYVGVFFETGPSLYFNMTNPLEAQLDWLRRERPDYLLIRSHALEHLAMACAGERPCDSLVGVTVISEAITPSTRRHLEAICDARIDLAYGLNEIGLVAARCEADRYHVHREHCLVEIIDEAGRPCRPGEAGRVVVTALQNHAMPLIRYDTDDLATATAEPCACGRTLPSFGEVHGRYSRLVPLPAGTLDAAGVLRTALQQMPAELSRGLRRYQIRQFRSGRFELRVMAVAPIAAALVERLQEEWQSTAAQTGWSLEIRPVAEIPFETTGDKFEDFVSEFVTELTP